ncbi:hypothetical protein VTN00DRAFT_8887 [Thermoascus crustaceus]|uniref:uncharacterized protein n=1 Tax=Thermoascus crustaceus TaxID=5088 RepID=UPI0037427856
MHQDRRDDLPQGSERWCGKASQDDAQGLVEKSAIRETRPSQGWGLGVTIHGGPRRSDDPQGSWLIIFGIRPTVLAEPAILLKIAGKHIDGQQLHGSWYDGGLLEVRTTRRTDDCAPSAKLLGDGPLRLDVGGTISTEREHGICVGKCDGAIALVTLQPTASKPSELVENVAYVGGLVLDCALGLACGERRQSLFSTSPRANGRSYAATLRHT